ncbi:BZ3500_MvSof-1268-A1-R1_Chr8-2g10128 [Microbotryum saponariae]|uniref:BZ3500_MvSof-1268-A1-R1_Chr8-2g10128 protein n=1 Tax=Microbotryum saponariae TaxID=289078 RepID=A0A2X0L5A1_9BASI|nr:BZ3500_MvSof-1268-A1-R1_Chr8-2g10128 [Microbotryum saponariae]SDA01841.1 BZ3501_MvSof-1269-A2-R1_Chr8-2g09879 [Microbotryum saponariae]
MRVRTCLAGPQDLVASFGRELYRSLMTGASDSHKKSFSSYNVTTSHSRASLVSAHSDSPVTVSSKLFDIASNASTSEAIPIADASSSVRPRRSALDKLSAFPSITDLRAALTGFVTPVNESTLIDGTRQWTATPALRSRIPTTHPIASHPPAQLVGSHPIDAGAGARAYLAPSHSPGPSSTTERCIDHRINLTPFT